MELKEIMIKFEINKDNRNERNDFNSSAEEDWLLSFREGEEGLIGGLSSFRRV